MRRTMMVVTVSTLVLLTGCKTAYLKEEPPAGSLSRGTTVYVDDGTCPTGQVKKVKAGGGGSSRVRECVAREDGETSAEQGSAETTVQVAVAAKPDAKLTADEITEILVGRTIKGSTNYGAYTQDFRADGTSTYRQRGIFHGKWYVTGDDQYCSEFEWGNRCYDLFWDGKELLWIRIGDGKRYASRFIK